jgi:hypothetical protein
MASTVLGCFVCKNNCSVAKVAAAFAFLPPQPPLYSIIQEPGAKEHELSVRFEVVELAQDPDYNHALQQVQLHIIKTKRGSIPGFQWTHPDAKFTLIYSHGNAMDCAVLFTFWMQLSQILSCNVFAYDYSGYGAATGEATVGNTMADMEAVYEYLVGRGVDPSNIVLYGQSVGTAPSCHLAAKRPVRGVILHSPCVSGLQVLAGPPSCCSPSCVFCLVPVVGSEGGRQGLVDLYLAKCYVQIYCI